MVLWFSEPCGQSAAWFRRLCNGAHGANGGLPIALMGKPGLTETTGGLLRLGSDFTHDT